MGLNFSYITLLLLLTVGKCLRVRLILLNWHLLLLLLISTHYLQEIGDFPPVALISRETRLAS